MLDIVKPESNVVSGGSMKILTQYFQQTLHIPNLKLVFIGDHYLNDIKATAECDTMLKI